MAGDPHALHPAPERITLCGVEYLARRLRLSGRKAVNDALRAAYPHPVLQAQQIITEAGIEDEAVRAKILDRGLSLWDGSGWPITLDSPLGRMKAMACLDVFGVVIHQALVEDQPDITIDDAMALADRATPDEIHDVFAVAFGIERKIFREAMGKLMAAMKPPPHRRQTRTR